MATRNITLSEAPHAREDADRLCLETPGVLGRHPSIGVVLFFIGALIFGFFAYNLFTNGPLIYWDKQIAASWTAYGLHHAALWRPITTFGFDLGSYVEVVVGILLIAYFSSWHHREELMMLIVGMAGDLALFEAVSLSIGRPRPPQQIWIVLHIPGFPSGHVMSSVVFFGFLAYLLVPKTDSVALKTLIILAALFCMAYVGFSRVFTGAHYMTDALAGYGLGLAWAAVAFPMVEIYYKNKRRKHGEKKESHAA